MSEILRKIEEEAKEMIGKDVYAKVSEIDKKVTKDIEDVRSDMEDFQEVIDETAESMEEHKKQCKEQNIQLNKAISSVENTTKQSVEIVTKKITNEIDAVKILVDQKVSDTEKKITTYDDSTIKRSIEKKADKTHKHEIKDVTWLSETLEEIKEGIDEKIKNLPVWWTSVWWSLKWIRALVPWTWISIDDTNAKYPVISATWWGWGGAVDSVNGQTWVVVLDADDIDDTSTTNKFVTATDIGKLWNITVTQAVDLDQMEADIAALANGMVYKWNWDASVGTFPWAWVAQTWWFYTVSVWWTVNSVVFNVDDRLVATVDNASTTIYAWNWTKLDATDAVTSINWAVGNVLVQSLPVVVSSSQTAVNDEVYTVVANATFTDPSPVEWKWYTVIVRNGTATIWGTWYSVEWSEILRIFHSWAWATYLKTPWGWATLWVWYDLTWTYVSTSTFTFSGDAWDAWAIERSLFTCLSTWGSTRRIWYVKSASHSAGTVTVTVVTDSDLASGDNTFKVAINRKIEDYQHLFTVPWEQVADASNPQGMFYRSLVDSYLLPVNSFVRTAASWSWAACAWNVYKWATNLFSSAQDMTTSTTFDERRPNTNTITAWDIITLRVTSSAWATNKASDLQVQTFIVPVTLYTTAD